MALLKSKSILNCLCQSVNSILGVKMRSQNAYWTRSCWDFITPTCLKYKISLTLTKNNKSTLFVKGFMPQAFWPLWGTEEVSRKGGKENHHSHFYFSIIWAVSPIRFVGTFSKAGLVDSPSKSHPGLFRLWFYTNWLTRFPISAY